MNVQAFLLLYSVFFDSRLDSGLPWLISYSLTVTKSFLVIEACVAGCDGALSVRKINAFPVENRVFDINWRPGR